MSDAITYAKGLLRRCDYTKSKLYKKLLTKFDEENSVSAIEELEKAGFLNDRLLADEKALELKQKGFAKKGIEQQLLKYGFSEDVVESCCEQIDSDEYAEIKTALEKSVLSRTDDAKKILRSESMRLIRRGFNANTVAEICEEIGNRLLQ